MQCLDANEIVSFLEGRGPDAFEAHVDRCADCRALVTELSRSLPVDETMAPEDVELGWIAASGAELVDRGMRVGRYVVLDPLGAGAMGVVYRAYDPELDRDVALKLVRVMTEDSLERARARLVREAQAMARLAHPNVVHVYDASALGEHVFVAMELVEGVDLASWLGSERPWQAIAEAFADAGRGLAAAHRAGIVHRDFKPSNVLVGVDGRVRVTDFGLSGVQPGMAAGSPADPRITADGTVIGTPAYMSPEVAAGELGDERSDQYSFARALSEAVGDPAPPRLRAAIARGLASDPAGRFPSMDAMVDALSRARRPRRVLPIAGLALAGAGLAAYALAGSPAEPSCGVDLAGVWDAPRKAEIRAAFANHRRGEDTWRRVEVALDDWAATFARDRVEACETHARGGLASELFELRAACLQTELARFTAVTAMFAAADASVVDRAPAASELVDRLAPCRDVARLRERPPLPLDLAVRAQLAHANAELAVFEIASARGRYPEAAAGALRIAETARRLGDTRLEAAALISRGESLWRGGDVARAEQTLHDGVAAAKRARAPDLEGGALLTLVAVLGWEDGRYDEALSIARLAEATISATGDDGRLGRLLANRAAIAYARRDLVSARADFTRARELVERAYGPRDRRVGSAIMNLAMLDAESNDPAALTRSLDLYAQALAIHERQLGSNHPEIALVLNNRAIALANLGRRDEARADVQRALAIRRDRLGPTHRDVAMTIRLIGEIELEAGRAAVALEHYREALALYERTLRPDHPELGPLHDSIGRALLELGRTAEAIPHLERALALFAAAKIESTSTALARFALARALWATDRERAAQLLAQARAWLPAAELDAWVKAHP